MSGRSRLGALLFVAAMLASTLSLGTASADTCGAQGCWSNAFSPGARFDANPPKTIAESEEYPTAASAVVLPTGQVLYWNGLQNMESCGDNGEPLPMVVGRCIENSESKILDLTGTGSANFYDVATNTGDDLFCADQRLMQNGKVIVAGGTYWADSIENPADPNGYGLGELYGSRHTRIFNKDGTWSLGDEMAYPRWYPSMATLPTGDMFIAGGTAKLLWNSSLLPANRRGDTGQQPYPQNVRETETFIYNAETGLGEWVDNGRSADVALPQFARIHLLPNGEILYTGTGQMWGPAGESADQLEWNWSKIYNPATKTWRNGTMPVFGARSGAFSAMLPLKAPYDKAQFLLAGGVLGTSPGTWVATDFAEVMTAKAGNDGKWTTTTERTGDLNNRRWYSSGVVLPNGQVLAVNGADVDHVIFPGIERHVAAAELYDPVTGKWTELPDSGRQRTYHNSALLLSDGSVLVGGHAPINQGNGGKAAENNNANGFASNLKDPSFERYYPPYLFAAPRPQIDTAQAHGTWGGELVVTMKPGSVAPTKFVLSRLPSVTHTTDMDQRTVEMPSFTRSGTSVSVQLPDNAGALPPGYYYVFAMNGDTPSVATVVQIAHPDNYVGGGNAVPVNLVDSPIR